MKPIANTVGDLFQPRELAKDEYLNEADGLIYCSKCHTPRQHRIELKERVFLLRFVAVVSRKNMTKKKQNVNIRNFSYRCPDLGQTACRTNLCMITTSLMIKATIRKYRKHMIM